MEVPIPLHRFEPYIDDIVLKYISDFTVESAASIEITVRQDRHVTVSAVTAAID